MSNIRPLALAVGLGLTVLASSPADAAAKKRAPAKAPATPAVCTDFYDQADAAWLKANPVPAAGATSALGQLADNALAQQRQLLDAAMAAPQGNVQKLLGDFWASGLDEAAVEADGSRPIAPLLARIDAIKRTKDVPAAFAALHQVGIPVAFNFSPDVDLKALDRHIGYFMQGGTGLPDPAYYTRTDADTVAVLGRYRSYVKQILALTGTAPDRLDADSASVLQVETLLARASRPLAEMANPFNNYAPVAVKDAAKQYRNLQLEDFLKAQGVKDDLVSLPNPEFFKQLNALVASIKPEQWQAYLRWRVGDAMAPYLSKAFREAEFDFRGRVLRGQVAPDPRWQQVLEAINVAAGPMLGHEYVARYLPPESRRLAGIVADQLRQAQIEAVKRSPWLSAEAKAEAQAKLDALKIEIGAPRRDLDYTVQPMGRGSFGGNMLIASAWRHTQEMKRIGKGNADRRWDVLPQQPALAYDPAQNRLIVTAAVLQLPVFSQQAAQATPGALYGAYGALVGRELTRAVDAKGAMVDAQGQLRSWWTPADKSAWAQLQARIAGQYDAYDYPGVKGAKVNGKLTADENLADLGGVELAWAAYAHAVANPAQADQQAFFNAWAGLWAQQLAPNVAIQRSTADIQAPGKWRTNAPLSNLPGFAASFSCKAGQPMVRSGAEQIGVWP